LKTLHARIPATEDVARTPGEPEGGHRQHYAGTLETARARTNDQIHEGDVAERARLSVTKNIRGAIEKIREANPALGRHLANSIKTGYLCSYSPDPTYPIVWRS
jgi:hypothetical protein